jgi:hypothetical protein
MSVSPAFADWKLPEPVHVKGAKEATYGSPLASIATALTLNALDDDSSVEKTWELPPLERRTRKFCPASPKPV